MPQLAAQAAQTVSAFEVQAVAGYVAGPQAVQALQVEPFSQVLALQLVHAAAPAPLQPAQLASHALQTVLVVAVHSAASYCVAPQALHALQAPPARYLPPAQLVHAAAPAPEHVEQATLQATQLPPLRYLPSAQPVH